MDTLIFDQFFTQLLENNTGLNDFLLHLNEISWTVVIILFTMSVLTWYLIITKAIEFFFTRWRVRRFLRFFGSATSLEMVINYLNKKGIKDPFSNLVFHGIHAALHHEQQAPQRLTMICGHSEFITQHMRKAIAQDTHRLESGLNILATIGSISPYIGLFGTVVGIYHALMEIGAKGQASLDTVAAPIGEALIMTAAGLAVAIPAVLAYNAFVRSNRTFFNELDDFAYELHTLLNTGARLSTHNEEEK